MAEEQSGFGHFEQQSLIIYKLGRIESMLAEMAIQNAATSVVLADTTKRVSKIENRMSWGAGVVAGISFITSVVMNFLIKIGSGGHVS